MDVTTHLVRLFRSAASGSSGLIVHEKNLSDWISNSYFSSYSVYILPATENLFMSLSFPDILNQWTFLIDSGPWSDLYYSDHSQNCFIHWLILMLIGPIPWGHTGPLCHALSLSSSSLSWTSMCRRHATVPLATWWMGVRQLAVVNWPNIFQMFLVLKAVNSLYLNRWLWQNVPTI